ncbi:cytochrome c biogenesis protein CcsA [Anaplasmataceae bacterium AB001_6]|nr:cytochrome c biogenesis protein CcsA [Anaplasmataceae bacterium AB001_6]
MIRLNNFLLVLNNRYLSIIFIIFCIIFLFATYFVFNFCEEDYLQGNISKIIYLHIPSAWLSIFIYVLMSFFSAGYIISNNKYFSIYAFSLSHIGAFFCFICIITGSIWGKNTWGSWWVWDPRLTSVLILMFLYLAYILLWEDSIFYSKVAAILNVLGCINIPIIKFSVNMWATLHQPSSFMRKEGIALDYSMLFPLFLFLISHLIFTLIIFLLRYNSIINMKKISRYYLNEKFKRY